MRRSSLILAGLFGFVFMLTFMAMGSFVSANDSVIIESSNSSFSNGDVGAWKITKEAKWIQKGKAQLTLTANSVSFDDGSARDVVYVVEASRSMSGYYPFVQAALRDASEDILADSNNTVSLITFNSTATINQGMTNDLDVINDAIDSSSYQGESSYYAAFIKLEELLSSYQAQAGRQLIVAFVSDGPPNRQSPLEVAEYRQIKASFPNIVINGVQVNYEGDIDALKTVTDNQIIWGKDAPSGIYKQFIVEATRINYNYDVFRVQDIIDTEKFTIDGAESKNGVVSVGSNAVSWNMDDAYRSGTEAKLVIDLTLKDSYLSDSLNDFYPSKKTTISTSIMDVPAENTEETSSPKLELRHSVSYQLNGPSGCALNNIPATTNEIVFDAVLISDKVPVCNGYTFRYWVIANDGVTRLNDDYFVMPNENVVLKAVWHKISIDKEVEGTVIGSEMALLGRGFEVNDKILALGGIVQDSYGWEYNYSIKKIRMADSLPRDFTPSESNTISDSTSLFPVYAWVDGDTLYVFTSAEGIYMNPTSDTLFEKMRGLEDISGISGWVTSKVASMEYMFNGDISLSDISVLANWNTAGLYEAEGLFSGMSSLTDISPLRNWNTSNLRDISQLFEGASSLTDISPLAGWDVSEVQYMGEVFKSADSLVDISPLSGWNTYNVIQMHNMFSNDRLLADISPLSGWRTDNVVKMDGMFEHTAITNVNALRRWSVGKVEDMHGLFESCEQLSDISALYYWNVSKVKDMNTMFYNNTSLSNFSPIRNWTVSNVENMGAMFAHNPLITDVNFLTGWNTASLKEMAMLLYNDTALTDISGLAGWNVSGVTQMRYAFYNDYSLTSLSPLDSWTVNSSAIMTGMFNDIPTSIARPNWYHE